jgi:hypothetical protein
MVRRSYGPQNRSDVVVKIKNLKIYMAMCSVISPLLVLFANNTMYEYARLYLFCWSVQWTVDFYLQQVTSICIETKQKGRVHRISAAPYSELEYKFPFM